MKLAVTEWNGRISPVFDSAGQAHLLDVENGKIVNRMEMHLERELLRKAEQLAAVGVHTLLCGAISAPMFALLAAQGIEVIPFVAGPYDEVVGAFLAGRLKGEQFTMPGCRRRRGRCNRWRGMRPRIGFWFD